MAANIYRFVGELAFGTRVYSQPGENASIGILRCVDNIDHNLGYSAPANHLRADDYDEAMRLIRAIRTSEKNLLDLFDFFINILPHYAAEWERLGRPATYEKWGEAVREKELDNLAIGV
jgi:hypothetical protein